MELLIVKLMALHRVVIQRLNSGATYYDPPTVINYFERYKNLKSDLEKKYQDLFNDIPNRDIPQPSNTTDFENRGYIMRTPLQMISLDMKEIIEIWQNSSYSNSASLSIRVSKEGAFFQGQYYDALSIVHDLISKAKQSIIIIDGYINQNIIKLVSGKGNSVNVKILTRELKPELEPLAIAFNKQHNGLCIKISTVFHDRFLIIDDKEYYHFGASIKDLGNRGFMFSLIEEPAIISAVRNEFDKQWAIAQIIINADVTSSVNNQS